MENNRILAARQVKIEHMMDALMELWNMGLEYVDVHGERGEDQDSVVLEFSKAYMDEEYKDRFDEFFKEDTNEEGQVTKRLTDDDINRLL